MLKPNVDWASGLGPPTFHLQIFRRYPPQDVRRVQFRVEEAFSSFFGGIPSQQASDPNTPIGGVVRFAIQGPKANLQVGDNSTVYNAGFPGRPGSGLRQPLLKAADELSKLDEVFSEQTRFFWTVNLATSFVAPSKDAQIVAIRRLMDVMFVDPPTEPVGFQRHDIISHGDYEIGSISTPFSAVSFEGVPLGKIQFDVDFTDMTEFGIEIKAEITSRPTKNKPVSGALRNTMQTLLDFLQLTPTSSLPLSYQDYL